MISKPPYIRWQTQNGEPLVLSNVTIIPRASVLEIRFPMGGMVWNRPAAIQVRDNNEPQYIPIVDVTRIITLALYGAGATISILYILLTIFQKMRVRA